MGLYRSVNLWYWFRRCLTKSASSPCFQNWGKMPRFYCKMLFQQPHFLSSWSSYNSTCGRRVSSAQNSLVQNDSLYSCVLIMGDTPRWVMTRGLEFLLFAGVWDQSRNACYFVPTSRKGKYSLLIGCIWLGCVNVTNRDVPNRLEIIWVISKSLSLSVCRQSLVLVCHIQFPLAIYHLTRERGY